jgi:inosose dehydratase
MGRLLAATGAEVLVLADKVDPESRTAQQAGRVRAPRLSAEKWDGLAETVDRLARSLHDETGLRLAFRHFVGTHVEIDDEVALLMERVDPVLVGLCLDTGHWRYAGGDVIQAIETYGERIWQVYLSDSDPTIRQFSLEEQLTFYEATQAGVLCALGSGDIDIPAVLRSLREQHYTGWLVLEQDSLSDDPAAQLLNARANRDFISRLEG